MHNEKKTGQNYQCSPKIPGRRDVGSGRCTFETCEDHPQILEKFSRDDRTTGRDSQKKFKNIKNIKNINPNKNKHSSFWNLQSCNVYAKFKVQTHYMIHQDYHYINNNF